MKKKKKKQEKNKKNTGQPRKYFSEDDGQQYYINEQGKKVRRKRCAAYARSTGKQCQRWAMDNGKCYMHGGANGKIPENPNPKAAYPSIGLYYNALMDDEERELYKTMMKSIDSLDEEIVMTKLKLRRAYVAQKIWEEGLSEDEKEEIEKKKPKSRHFERLLRPHSVEQEIGAGLDTQGKTYSVNKKKIVKRASDFTLEIKILTNSLVRMLRAKAELQMLTRGEEFKEELAAELREFSDFAVASVPEPEKDDTNKDNSAGPTDN